MKLPRYIQCDRLRRAMTALGGFVRNDVGTENFRGSVRQEEPAASYR